MAWRKLKQVFEPRGEHPWMTSHAANPFAKFISEHRVRVYFTSRDANNKSHIGYADVDMANNFEVVAISNEPVLAPGEPGLFDDSGVAMGFMLDIKDETFLYYLGWNLKVTVPWLNTIGLAKLDKTTGKFVKTSRAPMMDRSDEDPFSISYPSVMKMGNGYRMWYGSNLKWGKDQSEMQHVIKTAVSDDGIHWKRNFDVAVDLIHPGEYALSKPFVLQEMDGSLRMWYSYRANGNIETYRIGTATSLDGISWQREDFKVGIDVSPQGWDSEMISYPCVFEYNGNRYMLYNGNGYGRTGFGIAILDL